ncbi:MAG: multicopper oxidase domain-containing protein [Syntrophobacterales bacterium]|nr:multicopper oxidase domain-containing protein [Syntrophobacterales bacterium]
MDPLPSLEVADLTSGTGLGDPFVVRLKEFQAPVLSSTTVLPGGPYAGTWVWGYLRDGQSSRGSFIGPVIVARRDVPVAIKYVNELGSVSTTNVLAYKYSTDQTLHWADPLNDEENHCSHHVMPPAFGSPCAQNYDGPIPAVVHLHGGEVPPMLDGGPDAWFTSDGNYQGRSYYSAPGAAGNEAIYRYPNSQEAAPLWFHDHVLGVTRLNVYAGLAGAYLLTDPNLPLPTGLHPVGLDNGGTVEPLVPLVIQDRRFDTNGQLFFTADSAGGILWALNPEHPYWNPEFVGDAIVVNGKTWPFVAVQPKRYRFLLLNGSNARTYELFFTNQATGAPGPPVYVIGTDGGYLDAPVKLDPALGQKLVLQPGERYDIIVDFAGFANQNLLLRNTGRTPFPKGAPPQGATVGRILQVRVGPGPVADATYNPAAGTPLRPPMIRLATPATGTLAPGVTVHRTRLLTLNEVMGMPQTAIDPVTGVLTAFPGGPLEVLLNNTKWTGKRVTGSDGHSFLMEPIPGFTPVTLDGKTDYYSEVPQEGETEIWEIVNLTADAHPIHLHLVQFQLLNRQDVNLNKYRKAYNAAFPGGGYDPMTGLPYPAGVFIPGFGPPLAYDAAGNLLSGGKPGGNPDVTPYLQGPVRLPLPHETGWKDTVIVYPGQVTRLVVRWAPTDLPAATPAGAAYFPFDPQGPQGEGYVWHCHILDHEDNEMMRPTQVARNPAASRSYLLGVDY